MIKLGDTVKDEVTGLEGIALARLVALHEANQIRVHPQDLKPDGDVRPSVWFEETRLTVVKRAVATMGFKMVNEECS